MRRTRSPSPERSLPFAERAEALARLDAKLTQCERAVAGIAAQGAFDEAERLLQRIHFARDELDTLRRAAPDALGDDGHDDLWLQLSRSVGC